MRVMVTATAGERSALLSIDSDPLILAAELADRVSAEVGAKRGSVVRVDGRTVVEGMTVGQSGLHDGSAIQFGDPLHADEPSAGSVDLCVAGGLGAGGVARLGVGEVTLQLDSLGALLVDAPLAVGPAIVVLVAFDGSVLVRRAPDSRMSRSTVTLETLDEPLGDEETPWPTGAQLRIGPSALIVQAAARSDADLIPSTEPGRLDYNRPPRLLPPAPGMNYRLPAAPSAPTRNPLPWLAAALPAVLGIVTALVFRSPTFLLLALASPLMVVGNWLSSRRNGVKSHRRQVEEHGIERAALEEVVRDAVRREQHRRRATNPGPSELRLIATTPTRRLWERRATDPDHLEVRVGLANAPSRVALEDLAEPEHRRVSHGEMTSVPVTVRLRETGVLGIAGPGDWPRRRARWIVGQLGVLQSPRDVQIYLLTGSEGVQEWAWAAWLPHVRPTMGQDTVALLGVTAETLAARVSELSLIIAERRAAMADNSRRQATFSPDVVVILDGARRLRALPGVVAILRDGPAVGISVVCLDGDEKQLPEECTAVILARVDDGMVLRTTSADDVDSILVDEVVDEWFEEVARVVAPIRDVTASESEGLIPDAARLVEVLALEEMDAEMIASRWRTSRGTTEAVVGISIDGPFALDLVRDGPHALVAGTTGSGKSEFLQTIVASLAIVNTPDTMTFVLVDYKGGAAFSECANLPHTVGMVTDLDSHLVERALESLRAELTYREHVLADAAAKDLEDYVDAQSRGHVGPTLPRLAIVIDEFAAMAKELPDFVAGLVNIAQRGRSLGIHLILATQRPSGVISPEIRANANLRIALRMTDKSESSDVIDAPDAARIAKSQPGRAYARLGHASLLPFQTARVGGRRISSNEVADVEPPFVARLTPTELGGAVPQRATKKRRVADDTDLSAIVATLVEAAALSGIPRPRSPWLPALPELIGLDQLEKPDSKSAFAWGREDEPTAQRQAAATIDFDVFGHMYVVGAPGSGRSSVLRTMATSAASSLAVADLHIYAIDCGNGALAVLDELPHTGAVAQRNQTDRAVRLLTRLRAELARRQQILANGNFANATEQREHAAPGEAVPHVLVLVDRWESFVTTLGEIDGGALVDIVQELMRDGASAGIHLVIAGDRSLLASRMSVLTDDMFVLRLTDRLDFGMAGINHRTLPDEIPPGRGFRSRSSREIQTAVLGDDPSGRGQTEAIRRIALSIIAAGAVEPGSGPFRVDDLPTTIDLEGAYGFAGAEAAKPMWAMLGVGGDQIAAVGMDLAGDAPTFVIAGPARSGRSTMLLSMAESLLRSGTGLVVATPRMSPLRALEGRPGVRAVFTGTEIEEAELSALLDPDGTDVVFLVDDAEILADIAAKTWLRSYIRTAAENRRGLVIAGDVSQMASGFSGWQVDVKKNRRGALLSPQSALDGDLVGVRLPRSSVSSQVTPGRALVHLGTGELLSIMVPTVAAVSA
jgi:S-DNA-T family DNA segregation ATPase FtsK/SpoIIIE